MQDVADEIIEVQDDAKLDVKYREIKDPCGFIYITTNLVNGKKYLGLKSFDKDWKNYLGSGTLLKKAIKKYHQENFSRSIIDIAYSEDELRQKEYEYSVFLNVVESKDWYNLVYGGKTTLGYSFTDEQRSRLSEAQKGKVMSEEAKRKMSAAKRGHVVSDEARKRISEMAKVRLSIPENNPMFGKNPYANKTDAEMFVIKQKLSEAMSGSNNPMYGKKHTLSSRNKMSESQKGKHAGADNPFYGKTHTDKVKQHLRDINTGRKATEETKKIMSNMRTGENNPNAHPVYCVEMDEYFWGRQDVKIKYPNIPITNINLSCNNVNRTCGKHPTTGAPLHWKWATMHEYNTYIERKKSNGETV